MFTFALAFFFRPSIFFSSFSTIHLFRGKRKKEFGRKHSQRKPLTTTTTWLAQSIKLIALLTLQHTFHLFQRQFISKSGRKLMNYKLENRIPWLFTDFDKFSFFPDRGNFVYNRWDKNRKRKVPCADSVRFTQLWSKHSQFREYFILNHKKRFN